MKIKIFATVFSAVIFSHYGSIVWGQFESDPTANAGLPQIKSEAQQVQKQTDQESEEHAKARKNYKEFRTSLNELGLLVGTQPALDGSITADIERLGPAGVHEIYIRYYPTADEAEVIFAIAALGVGINPDGSLTQSAVAERTLIAPTRFKRDELITYLKQYAPNGQFSLELFETKEPIKSQLLDWDKQATYKQADLEKIKEYLTGLGFDFHLYANSPYLIIKNTANGIWEDIDISFNIADQEKIGFIRVIISGFKSNGSHHDADFNYESKDMTFEEFLTSTKALKNLRSLIKQLREGTPSSEELMKTAGL